MKVKASFMQVRYKTYEETSTSGMFAAVEKTVNVYNGKGTKQRQSGRFRKAER